MKRLLPILFATIAGLWLTGIAGEGAVQASAGANAHPYPGADGHTDSPH